MLGLGKPLYARLESFLWEEGGARPHTLSRDWLDTLRVQGCHQFNMPMYMYVHDNFNTLFQSFKFNCIYNKWLIFNFQK